MLLYWKEILIGVATIALISLGVYIRGVVADNDALKVQVAQEKAKAVEIAKMNEGLTKAVAEKTSELQAYITLNARIANDKANIQWKYADFVKKVHDETLKIKPGVGLTEPYILTGAGVPSYRNYSTGSYHP